MKLKCALGYHDWGKPSFTKTSMVYECRRCHMVKARYLPMKAFLLAEMAKTTMHLSVVTTLLFAGRRDLACEYAKILNQKYQEETDSQGTS